MIRKLNSIIHDERLPHFLPYTFTKKIFFERTLKTTKPEKIFVSMTFDIEPSPADGSVKCSKVFLSKAGSLLKDTSSTLFVCGNLLNRFSNELKRVQTECEIGLHGYDHEVWGDYKWWLSRIPKSQVMKENLLNTSIEIFKKNRLQRPKTFRAPFMVSNEETINLLKKHGFSCDSSPTTYVNGETLPIKAFGMSIIPVTADPVPQIKMRGTIPTTFYKIFNMENFHDFDEGALMKFVDNATTFQTQFGFQPHLVFLAHPWEFIHTNRFDYCSEKNLAVLKRIIDFLKKSYECKFVRMNQLSKEIFDKNDTSS